MDNRTPFRQYKKVKPDQSKGIVIMAGTKAGGENAAATNKKKYGPDFYKKIGAMGGAKGKTGGFAAGPEGKARARHYGAIGGRNSRRGKRSDEYQTGTAVHQSFAMA